MLNLSAFENSLRGGDAKPSKSTKNCGLKKHNVVKKTLAPLQQKANNLQVNDPLGKVNKPVLESKVLFNKQIIETTKAHLKDIEVEQTECIGTSDTDSGQESLSSAATLIVGECEISTDSTVVITFDSPDIEHVMSSTEIAVSDLNGVNGSNESGLSPEKGSLAKRKKRIHRITAHVDNKGGISALANKQKEKSSQNVKKVQVRKSFSCEGVPEQNVENGLACEKPLDLGKSHTRTPVENDDVELKKYDKNISAKVCQAGKGKRTLNGKNSVCDDSVRKSPLIKVGTAPNRSVTGRSPGARNRSVKPMNCKTVSKENAISWTEVAAKAVNRKPNSAILDDVYYKDFGQLVENSAYCLPDEAKSEEQLASERCWLETERLWLIHRGGFTAVRVVSHCPETAKLRIRLEASPEEILVDEDDLEKANPPKLDRAEDLSLLRYLNESSALHTLRQRYAANLIHTYAGDNLLIINPMAPFAIYSEKVGHMFRGCKSEDMPAHIYSIAQSAYRGVLASRRDHSIVFLGQSGSGKTTNYRHTLHYLALAAGSVNKVVTPEKLNAIWTLLEAFGNARTSLNANATRFTHIFNLDFDQSGMIASASIQILLSERWRVVRRPEGELSFHVIYRLLNGCEGYLRRELFLDHLTETNSFIGSIPRPEDRQKATGEFSRLCGAFTVIGVSDAEAKVIWSVLASVLHLGAAGAVRGSNSSRWQFNNQSAAQRAAQLLGTTSEELSQILFGQGAGTPTAPRTPFRTPSPTGTDSKTSDTLNGMDALEGLAVGLYSEVFNAIGALINRCISAPVHTVSSLLVMDCPGIQNPVTMNPSQSAGFSDLCHNYLNERLQQLFYQSNIVVPRDRYNQEHIEVLECDEYDDPTVVGSLVSVLDRAQSTIVRSSQPDLQQLDRKGVLWILDEITANPSSTDATFVEKIFNTYSDRESQAYIRKGPAPYQIILQHCQGTNPVLYSVEGWLKESRENPTIRLAATLLQESAKQEVAELFVLCRGAGISSSLGGSVAGIESLHSLRRASSIRRTTTAGTAAIKRKSVSLQVKFTSDGIVETLRRTKLKFVFCFVPHYGAGFCESSAASPVSQIVSPPDTLINIPLLRTQLRGSHILSAVRLYKQGFPTFLPIGEFRRRFRLLAATNEGEPPALDVQVTNPPSVAQERTAVEEMLMKLEVDSSSYRLGLSQVFFRAGVLPHLEAQRDEKLTDRVIKFQACCRGYVSRKRFAKLKVEQLAVRCIQRNVRKFLSVRNWPWWRLLVRVTPLLNVHRTEEELRTKTEELEALRSKYEKLEQERTQLKHENGKLEAKVSYSIQITKYSAN